MPRPGNSASFIVCHWLLAVSILFLFVSSWWMLSLPLPSDTIGFRVIPFQLHKNIGISLFMLILFMLFLRMRGREKAVANPALGVLERRLATLDHILLYGLIAACCLSGYLSSSFSGWSTQLWWLIDLPHWGGDDDELNILFSDIHLWSCWLLLAFMGLHIAAAMLHAFKGDGAVDAMFRISPQDK